jgi:hypothetical protein
MSAVHISNFLKHIELKHRIEEYQDKALWLKTELNRVYEEEDPCEEDQYLYERCDATLSTMVTLQNQEACQLWNKGKNDLLEELLRRMSNDFKKVVNLVCI